MALVTRNSLKGYVFQNYVLTLLLAKMDTERAIVKMESESETPGQFDDIYVEENKKTYRIQVKNYPDTTLDDIVISDCVLTIKGNKNKYCRSDNNILIVNTSRIETNTTIMGFKATICGGIYVVPLTPDEVCQNLDEMFRSESRAHQIVHLGQKLTSEAKFTIQTKDLPPLIRISTDLENRTILLREPFVVENGILFIEGQPGIGKSHFVNEMKTKNPNAIVYRFWTSSQDDNLKKRLDFQTFIEDLGIAVFDSAKNFNISELITEINTKELTIFIDGLDHVENYNSIELKNYIEFINSIKSAKIAVFSRPLKAVTNWETMVLGNWSFDELLVYLSYAHEINEYSVSNEIFSVTDGYPIISYFIAEEYKLTKKINFDYKLNSINQYYDSLLSNIGILTPLTIFATNNSFFVYDEFNELLNNVESTQILYEFIKCYPFLFKQCLNRYSLMHDSLNTYLRNQLVVYDNRRKLVTEKVKASLFSGEVRYMSRLLSFDFSEDFFDELLQKYSDFTVLRELLEKTLDFNSITDFYNHLQLILEKRNNALDIYQLYTFALIHQSVNRNDLLGFDELVFQILLYIKRYSNIEDCIYSSGAIWNLFVLLKTGNESEYKRFLSNKHYSQENISEVYDKINKSVEFFEIKNTKIDLQSILKDLNNPEKTSIDKRDLLITCLLSSWINSEENEYLEILNEFMYKDEISAIEKLLILTKSYNIEQMWVSSALNATRYKLHELGYFEDDNMFRNVSIKDFISTHSYEGSFEIIQYMESYLRLLNHEQRETDIFSINLAWIMHYSRKDYSVCNMDLALIQFEKQKLLKYDTSIEIIKKAMHQSEKGIRLLMTSYLNMKPVDFTIELINLGFFKDNSDVSFFELNSEHINCFDEKIVRYEIIELLKHHWNRTISYLDIKNIFSSKYKDMMLNYLKYNGYNVFEVYDDSAVEMFEKAEISYLKKEITTEEYIPFKYGCIHENDKEYILENKVPYTEICSYTDGWYSSFPLIDFYLLFDQVLIKKDYLKIIHTAMFARTSSIQRIGNWFLLLGNIPLFLTQTKVDIEWERLYTVFKQFLSISSIVNESDIDIL